MSLLYWFIGGVVAGIILRDVWQACKYRASRRELAEKLYAACEENRVACAKNEMAAKRAAFAALAKKPE